MYGREFGPPPEARDWHPPAEAAGARHNDADLPVERTGDVEQNRPTPGQPESPTDSREPGSTTDRPAGEAVAEREAAEAIEQEVRSGLTTLHEQLQDDPDIRAGNAPEEARFNKMLDSSGILAELMPKPRRDLLQALRHEKELRTADVSAFTEQGVEILSLWMHLQALNRAADERLAGSSVETVRASGDTGHSRADSIH